MMIALQHSKWTSRLAILMSNYVDLEICRRLKPSIIMNISFCNDRLEVLLCPL